VLEGLWSPNAEKTRDKVDKRGELTTRRKISEKQAKSSTDKKSNSSWEKQRGGTTQTEKSCGDSSQSGRRKGSSGPSKSASQIRYRLSSASKKKGQGGLGYLPRTRQKRRATSSNKDLPSLKNGSHLMGLNSVRGRGRRELSLVDGNGRGCHED